MPVVRIAVAAFALSLAASAGTAFGQEIIGERPLHGLFGGASGGPQAGQTLDLKWSFFTAKDDNAQTGGSVDPRTEIRGAHSLLGANLVYATRHKHSTLTISAASEGRYYPDLKALNAFDGHLGANFTTSIGQKAALRITQTVGYQPYYQFNFLPGPATLDAAPGSSAANALTASDSYDAEGRIEFQRSLGRRSTIMFGYGHHRTSFSNDQRFSSDQADTQFTRGLTRSLSLKAGYGYTQALNTFGTSGPEQVNHTINLGVDYRRSLSFSRRTSIGFSSGSTVTSPNGHREVHVIGDANIAREIGRTWKATAGYQRGVQFMPGFSAPLLADTFRLQLGGLVGRRVTGGLTAAYSSGAFAGSTGNQRYTNVSGTASVRVAVSRALAVETQYLVYRYDFDRAINLPLGLPSTLNRQGFRIGLTGLLPFYR